MRTRVSRLLSRCSLAASLAVFIAPAAAQQLVSAQQPIQFQQPAMPAAPPVALPPATEQVSIAAESLPTEVSSLLQKGGSLESQGHWAEALSFYDEALHEHPEDAALTGRFDVARLHYSLEQRYDDRSFRDALTSLHGHEGAELYDDLLTKINAHYYTTPPWQSLVHRGGQSLDIALIDKNYLTTNGIRANSAQIDQLRGKLQQLINSASVDSLNDAVAVATQAAQLANRSIGLSETATMLEFTSAAAGGLDHYSAFLTADQLRDIYSQIEGNFVGLGVELKADKAQLLIVHVIPKSPAEQAGIKAGDHIVAVDGQQTDSLSTDEAATLLTGAEGSVCRVTVVTAGQSPRELNVTRSHVDVPSLEGVKIIDQTAGVAYIRIPAFQKTTSQDLEAALWDLHRQGMQKLILDLRGNPGGLLTASVEIADKFIADGGIVSTRGRSEQENFNYRAHRPGTWRVPLVVLIDGDSASASEIFAAAIKDNHRGTIIGSRSYGKGSVQGIFPLGYAGAGARITTAKFFSPDGHPIANVGVTPDIDARRGTLVAAGEQAAAQPSVANPGVHQVGFRGVNSAADAPVTTPAVASEAAGDEVLEKAISVASTQPPVQL
ncbi:MAG TPA: S41 family peptidase [Pirellulaceae bacterium]